MVGNVVITALTIIILITFLNSNTLTKNIITNPTNNDVNKPINHGIVILEKMGINKLIKNRPFAIPLELLNNCAESCTINKLEYTKKCIKMFKINPDKKEILSFFEILCFKLSKNISGVPMDTFFVCIFL